MKIRITSNFYKKFDSQIDFVAKDKPLAARNFKKLVFKEIKKIKQMPFKNRKSIYVENDNSRDLIVKGYAITYFINEVKNEIQVFGFTKWEEDINM